MEEKECEILVFRLTEAEAEHYPQGYYQRKKIHFHMLGHLC